MYPLNMTLVVAGLAAGFAVANDEAEHAALTAQGYEPKLQPAPAAPAPASQDDEKTAVMAILEKAGIKYDKRSGIEKLRALLPQE